MSALRQYRADEYIPGASFEHVMKLEAFDFKLARVCMEGLLDFEVRLRAAMAHTLAAKNVAAHSSKEFLDARICDQLSGDKTKFEAWMDTCREAVISGAEDEDFIAKLTAICLPTCSSRASHPRPSRIKGSISTRPHWPSCSNRTRAALVGS